MGEQRILRVSKREHYVVIDRRTMDDPRLSLKAKGVLAYLLSKPDNWITNIQDIKNHCTDGEYSVRAALRELTDAGYITRTVVRDRHQRIVRHEYIVHEIPAIIAEQPQDATEVQSPHRDNLHVENRALSINDNSKLQYPTDTVLGEPPKEPEQPVEKPATHAGVDFFKKSFGIEWVNPASYAEIVRLCEQYGDERFANTVRWAAYRRIPSAKALPAITTALAKSPDGAKMEARHEEPTGPATYFDNDAELAELLAAASNRRAD